MKLSVIIPTKNEQENIGACIDSVKNISDEIIVVDEKSTDETQKIAKSKGAKVYEFVHKNNFHETKQYALSKAKGDWVLQLDADERVSPELSKEIKKVLGMSDQEIVDRRPKDVKKWKLFQRHQQLIEERDGKIGKNDGEIAAFYIPRVNYFLGKPLIYAGVYPDGVIRLVKKAKARFPAKSVHEQIEVDGRIAWLFHDLEHHDSPTLRRYLARFNRYSEIRAGEYKSQNKPKNAMYLLYFTFVVPTVYFAKLFYRHRGYRDGVRGFLWSVFSAIQLTISYYKYYISK